MIRRHRDSSKHQNNSQNELKIVNEHMKYIKLDSNGKNLKMKYFPLFIKSGKIQPITCATGKVESDGISQKTEIINNWHHFSEKQFGKI